MTDRNISPYEIQQRLHSWLTVIKQVKEGLAGNPFVWSSGEREAHTPKLLMIGITLVTKTQIEKRGYRLKKNVKPVGNAYFRSPISRSADLYVLECQCVILTCIDCGNALDGQGYSSPYGKLCQACNTKISNMDAYEYELWQKTKQLEKEPAV